MTDRTQYTQGPACAAESYQFWSAHVHALERHLSVNKWALAALTVVLITYPIGRIAIPAAFHDIVPDLVRAVLSFV